MIGGDLIIVRCAEVKNLGMQQCQQPSRRMQRRGGIFFVARCAPRDAVKNYDAMLQCEKKNEYPKIRWAPRVCLKPDQIIKNNIK